MLTQIFTRALFTTAKNQKPNAHKMNIVQVVKHKPYRYEVLNSILNTHATPAYTKIFEEGGERR